MKRQKNPVVEFLNQGRMPFVGRQQNLEELLQFWRQTLDRDRLGAFYLEGEAGIGKSRLVEELIERVVEEGGEVIHTRLYPESSTSFASLVAEAISASPGRRALLPTAPKPEPGSVAKALKRIARLRSTLLIVEDVHLLEGDGLDEFNRTLQVLADEHLSLLCAARPVDTPARSYLEPFLIAETILQPIEEPDARKLWSQLFGDDPTDEGLQALLQTTIGNPLAIRSALRGALRQSMAEGMINFERKGEDLAETFRLGVERYADGLASHLNEEEREVAGILSWLGEVFDRSTAEEFLRILGKEEENVRSLIASLRFKGVLASPNTRVHPLRKAPGIEPIAFTHSLFHRQLLEESAVSIAPLCTLLTTLPVLYSTVPYQILRDYTGKIDLPFSTFYQIVTATNDLVNHLTSSPDWAIAQVVGSAVQGLYRKGTESFSAEERRDIQIVECRIRLANSMSRTRSDEYREAINSLLDLTLPIDSLFVARSRIVAIQHDFWSRRATMNEVTVLGMIDEVLSFSPEMMFVAEYGTALIAVTRAAVAASNQHILAECEKRWFASRFDETLWEDWRLNMGLSLCFGFTTQEEFERKYQQFVDICRSSNWEDVSLNFLMLIWSLNAMFPAWYLKHGDRAARRAQEVGALGNEAHVVIESLCCRLMLGEQIEEIMPELEETSRLNAHISPHGDRRDCISPYGGRLFSQVLVLRNELESAREIATLSNSPLEKMLPLSLLIIFGEKKRFQEEESNPLFLLDNALRQGERKAAADHARTLLTTTPLRQTDLLNLYAGIALLERADMIDDSFRAMIRERLLEGLHFCHHPDRELYAIMEGIVERHEAFLTSTERKSWLKRAAELRKRESEPKEASTDPHDPSRLSLSMIGEISLRLPGEEESRLRGGRLKRTLGTLVIDQLLDRPLEPQELTRIALEEDDPEKGKRSMKVAVHRVRELLGKDAVEVRDGRPWLNENLVQVDLVDAVEHLKEAEVRLGKGELGAAARELEAVCRLIGDEILLPELYGTMFEAIRDEIEGRQRETGIGLVGSLLREGDSTTAEKIANLLLERMPEDDEIADLLHTALMNQGRLVDAERVRTRPDRR